MWSKSTTTLPPGVCVCCVCVCACVRVTLLWEEFHLKQEHSHTEYNTVLQQAIKKNQNYILEHKCDMLWEKGPLRPGYEIFVIGILG